MVNVQVVGSDNGAHMSCLPTLPRLDVAPAELAAFGGMGYKYCAPTELLPMLNPGLGPWVVMRSRFVAKVRHIPGGNNLRRYVDAHGQLLRTGSYQRDRKLILPKKEKLARSEGERVLGANRASKQTL